LGVRELVLAGGLVTVLPFDQALLLAAVLRALTLIADGVLLALAGVVWLKRRNLVPGQGS
jgi:hypothetical protein